jgi:hypothetical protein
MTKYEYVPVGVVQKLSHLNLSAMAVIGKCDRQRIARPNGNKF